MLGVRTVYPPTLSSPLAVRRFERATLSSPLDGPSLRKAHLGHRELAIAAWPPLAAMFVACAFFEESRENRRGTSFALVPSNSTPLGVERFRRN